MKLNKKIMLSAFAGASAVGAITPALVTSVSANKLLIPDHVYQSEDDLKYGLDNTTYEEVKQNFYVELAKKLESEGIEKGSEIWNKEMDSLQNQLSSFDNYSKKNNCSYTELTTGVIDVARKHYNIPLRRTTNAKWSDIIDMFNGTLNSVTLYMDHEHLPSQVQKSVINSATSKFNVMLANLEEDNYKECDPYGAMIEVRKEMLSFFDILNARVAKISASIKLNTFLNRFIITPKKNGVNYSQIKDQLVVGEPIENINDMITFIDANTGVETTFVADRMIAGYIVTPRFNGFKVDKEKNSYAIDIDWTAVSNHYANTNEALDAEGHMYEVKGSVSNKFKNIFNKVKDADKSRDILDITFKNMDVRSFSYSINETLEGQSQSIIDTYFGKDGLTFVWPSNADSNTRLEPFYNQLIDRQYIYNVPADLQEFVGSSTLKIKNQGIALTQDLADAGLMVQDINNGQKTLRYLSEVINTVKTKKNGSLTLAEKFVSNCNVFSLTKIGDAKAVVNPDGQVNERNSVKNEFYISYANQFNKNIDVCNYDTVIEYILRCQKSKEWTILPENKQPGASIDYVTSEQYFFNLCKKYSVVKDMVDLYSNATSKVKDVIKGWEANIAPHVMMLVSSAIAIVSFSILLYEDITIKESWNVNGFRYKESHNFRICMDIGGILLGLLSASYCSAILAIISLDILKPLKNLRDEYKAKYESKHAHKIFDKIRAALKEDSAILSYIKVQPKKDAVIDDKADYEKKLQLYYKNPFSTYKNKLAFYSNYSWSKNPGLTSEEVESVNELSSFFNTLLTNWCKKVYGTTTNFDGNALNGNIGKIWKLSIPEIIFTALTIGVLMYDLIFLHNAKEEFGSSIEKFKNRVWSESWFIYFVVENETRIWVATVIAVILVAISTIWNIASLASLCKSFNTPVPTDETLPESIDIEQEINKIK